jgi:hypothetical protein
MANDWDRLDSHFAHHQFFLAQIQWLIQRRFITLFWIFWKIQMKKGKLQIFWCGGIGKAMFF